MSESIWQDLHDGDETEATTGAGGGWYFACCDCGLVHRVTFRIMNRRTIRIVVVRDNRRTALRRRWMKARKKGGKR